MSNQPLPIIRIDEWNMRAIFNGERFYERTQTGELTVSVRRDTHPSRTVAEEPFCTRTQEVSYFDGDVEVARVHQYLRKDGTIGASGLPDPKRLVKDGIMYRLTSPTKIDPTN